MNSRRYATVRGAVEAEDISIEALRVRDKGICGICNLPIEERGTIDHVVSISNGGQHTWDNVQLAHFLCNVRKGNRD